jgi:hypothetical protein
MRLIQSYCAEPLNQQVSGGVQVDRKRDERPRVRFRRPHAQPRSLVIGAQLSLHESHPAVPDCLPTIKSPARGGASEESYRINLRARQFYIHAFNCRSAALKKKPATRRGVEALDD